MSDPTIKSPLKSRAANAGKWIIGGQVMAAAIRLGGNLVLTRLLAPQMFGLMAIIYVLMSAFMLFSDLGLGPSIVQSKRGEDQNFLDTVWVIQIIRGFIVWLMSAVLGIALYVAGHNEWLPSGSVYADPSLPIIIVAYSTIYIFSGFYPTKRLVMNRQFSLARATQIEIATQIIGLIIMVIWAYLSESIWALVWGTVLTAAIKLCLFNIYLPGQRNRWRWDPLAFKEILSFGKWIFVSSILGFLFISGDRLLLGGLVDTHQLGLYSIAYLIMSFPMISVGQLIGGVAFPALSEVVRNNPSKLKEKYYQFRWRFDSVLLFASGTLFCFGSSLIKLLYDDRYQDAGPILEILALSLIATRYDLADRCYMALGKPNLLTPLNLIRLLVLFSIVPLAFSKFQFDGAIWAIALCPFINLPMIFYLKVKNEIFDWKKELLVLPVFLAGAVAGIILSALSVPLQSLLSSLHAMLH